MSDIAQDTVSSSLASLFVGIEIKTKSSGPGRGHKGITVKKFSATMPEDLYEDIKALGGLFSSHVTAACEVYLRLKRKSNRR
jgi:hypothetical protein